MKHFAFDLDGVLADSYLIWWKTVSATRMEFGGDPVSEEDFRPGWGQGIEDDIQDWFFGRPKAEIEACYSKFFPRFLDQARIIEGAEEFVRGLKQKGHRLAVVTNSPRDIAEGVLKHIGLREYFDHVITDTDVPHPKPAPDMILLAAEKLGCKPGEMLVIGDSEFDRQAAKNAGCPFHHFRSYAGLNLD